jgi:ATP diphosphatase
VSAPGASIEALLVLMARLRDPQHGCPWDIAQDFASIAPYTLEEAHEVAEAIASGDPVALRDELGDLLFQVVFHARMAEERGWFDFAQVSDGISAKLERRHPHVFRAQDGDASDGIPVASTDPRALNRQWEQIKVGERAAAGLQGTLAGVPLALPALTRAAKLSRRAGRVGFDWRDAAAVRPKVAEELAELDAAIAAQDAANTEEEVGDLLFAIVNWARHLEVDPEAALRASNRKFEHRFAAMEALARERGIALASLDEAAWEALYQEARRQLRECPAAGMPMASQPGQQGGGG